MPPTRTRRLFNLAAAVSLGMMLATMALWVRSYAAPERFERYSETSTSSQTTRVRAVRGWFGVGRYRHIYVDIPLMLKTDH